MTRLWVDDIRTPPDEGWLWARTNEEARAILIHGDVDECSLDHDMGLHMLDVPEQTDNYWDQLVSLAHAGRDKREPNGVDLVNWMIEHGCVPSRVVIHSWNSVGALAMAARLNDHGHHCVIQAYKRHA